MYFLQTSVKISKCNRSCKLMHIYCQYIDIYLFSFAFESPQRTAFRLKVLYFLLKSLRNGECRGRANRLIVTKPDIGGVGVEKAFCFSVT